MKSKLELRHEALVDRMAHGKASENDKQEAMYLMSRIYREQEKRRRKERKERKWAKGEML